MSIRETPSQKKMVVIHSDVTHYNFDVNEITDVLSKNNRSKGKDLAAFVIKHNARRELPYGIWFCVDGSKIIFNREYQPILQKKNGINSYVNRNLWIENIETVQYFYNDATTPVNYLVKHLDRNKLSSAETKDCKKSLLICLDILREFTPKESKSVSGSYSVAK